MGRLIRAVRAGAIAASLLLSPAGLAQSWPAKPIRVVLPFPPGGGGIDVMARLIGQKVTETYGQPVIVENRSGASGAIAGEFVARSAPDGYTFFFTTPGIIVNSIFMGGKLPYDALKDFTPVTAVVEPVTCMVVSATLPVNSVRELVDNSWLVNPLTVSAAPSLKVLTKLVLPCPFMLSIASPATKEIEYSPVKTAV